LGDGKKGRQGEWTDSIADGSKAFIEKVKLLLGFKAKGRDIVKGEERYHLREEAAPYKALFDAERGDMGPENTYSWDINTE
jgi:putative transposase